MDNDIPISGIWRHYKGQLYLVIGLGQHTETDEKMVVYVPLHTTPGQTGPALRLRPASMWFDWIEGPFVLRDGSGVDRVQRFTFVGHER